MNATTRPSETKTAIVAGGAGFVGSHLCDALLAQGYHVVCVDNFLTGASRNIEPLANQPRFALVEHDICDPLTFPYPVDEIYNLACAASPGRYQADPIHTMMTNVVGVGHLLDIAGRDGAKFLQASTSEVYGDPEAHPQAEDYWGHVNCIGPRACYDEGKRAAESLCFDMLRREQVDARVARIFNTYGPRMQHDDGRIVSNLIVQALSGRPLTIYGSGEQTRSFCFVSDLIEGLLALMRVEPNPGVPVNLGNPGEFTVNALAERVLSITGSSSRPIRKPLPQDDPKRRRPDITRANTLLGWRPKVPLDEGLDMTVAYFSDWMAHNQPKPASRKTVMREARVAAE